MESSKSLRGFRKAEAIEKLETVEQVLDLLKKSLLATKRMVPR